MPVLQPIHKTGPQAQALRRRLLATAQQPIPAVLASTIEDTTIIEDIIARAALADQIIAGLAVKANTEYYLVRSKKFTTRFYVVASLDNRLICSSREQAVQALCIQIVTRYITTHSVLVAS